MPVFMAALRLLGTFLMVMLKIASPFLIAALLVFLLWRYRKYRQQQNDPTPRQEEKDEPHFSGPVYTVNYEEVKAGGSTVRPDVPMSFGPQTAWVAVRCDDPTQLLFVLSPKSCRPSNWAAGLSARAEKVFVTPCIDGWVMAVGSDQLPMPEDLAKKFDQVLAFADHRASGYYRWGRWENGVCRRAYCWCGDQHRVLQDEGELTREEIALGFGRFPRMGKEAGCEGYPTGEDVLDLAEAWGLDPRFSRREYPPSAGWVCEVE